MKFYDRADEIRLLKKAFSSGSAFIVVYGRRRVGKTRLVQEFLGSRNYLYLFVPDDKEEAAVAAEWKDSARSMLGYVPDVRTTDEMIRYLFETQKGMTIFIDEFQNITKVNQRMISLLQKYVDLRKESGRFFIIVSGSYVGMMKKIFQERKSPLFNRADIIMNLRPLPTEYVFEMLEDLGVSRMEEKIGIFSVLGGVPKYYEIIGKMGLKTLDDVVSNLFVFYPASLRDEARNILINEFGRKYKIYFSILEAVAAGKTSLNDIANFVGKQRTSLMKYIIDLQREYDIILRNIPITEKHPQKSKQGIYSIKDPLFGFWFRFIHRNYSYFERGMEDYVHQLIKRDINMVAGKGFEGICTEFLRKLNSSGKLPSAFSKTGKWWGNYRDTKTGERKTHEIDIVALNEQRKEILFAECKWQDRVDVGKVLAELKEKSRYVQWNSGKRKEHYAIFAKSFKNREIGGVKLYDLKDIEKLFRRCSSPTGR